jgi:hypothetical protein
MADDGLAARAGPCGQLAVRRASFRPPAVRTVLSKCGHVPAPEVGYPPLRRLADALAETAEQFLAKANRDKVSVADQ